MGPNTCFFGTLAFGMGLGFLGYIIGIAAFCTGNAGAQCGFGGVFLTGPLAFTAGVAIYLLSWAKRGKAP